MNRDTIENAAKDDFQSLMDIREVQDFEAKQKWPDFARAGDRWEFVKDVAAMANGGGGIVVFGIGTQRLAAEQADVTGSVHLLARSSCNSNVVLGIVAEHVIPQLSGIRVDFVEARSHAGRGILMVEVPAQASKVLLCKAMEGDEPLKEYLFGYVERDHDGTKNWTRDQVTRMIRSGTDAICARLEGIEQTLLRMETSVATFPSDIQTAPDDMQLKSRIDETLSDE